MKDLYITIDGDRIDLRRLDGKIAGVIKNELDAGKVVFEVAAHFWSGSANNLPNGIQAMYVSGSQSPIRITPGSEIAVAGEVGFFRIDRGQQKVYRNLLVQSGSNCWFFGKEFKDFQGHYYSGSHPTGSIWEKIHPNWPNT